MSEQRITPMTQPLAEEIAAWQYPGEYAVYDWREGTPLDELLDGSTYAVLNITGDLVGFYQFGQGARVPVEEDGPWGGSPYREGPLDIGFGLRPDLCGLGLGKAFVLAGMKFAQEELGARSFRLTVAEFNQRARTVYGRCGFSPSRRVTQKTTGSQFLIMGTQELCYKNSVTTESYCQLREALGWSAICPQQDQAGLVGSAYVVGCYDGETAVGSARLLWDGGYTVYLTDVMVLPEYQGLGIGTKMVERCMDFLRAQLRPGWRFKVHLLANQGREGFYQRFGFVPRPNENAGPAMDQWIEWKEEETTDEI